MKYKTSYKHGTRVGKWVSLDNHFLWWLTTAPPISEVGVTYKYERETPSGQFLLRSLEYWNLHQLK